MSADPDPKPKLHVPAFAADIRRPALEKRAAPKPQKCRLGFCPPSASTSIVPVQTARGSQGTESQIVERPRLVRVPLGEALRKKGVDENALAEIYAEVIEKLKCRTDEGGVEKLLIEVLKECSRLLEKENAAVKTESGMPPIRVIHHVERPQRGPQPSGDNRGANT